MRQIILLFALSIALQGSALAQCQNIKSSVLKEMPQSNLQEAFCAALKESDRLMQQSLIGSTTIYIRQVNACMDKGKLVKQIYSQRFGISPKCKESLDYVKYENTE